jgi:hypothetical protein
MDHQFKKLVNQEFELQADHNSISDQIVILKNMENNMITYQNKTAELIERFEDVTQVLQANE